VRVLDGTLPVAENQRWLAALEPARTRVMLLVALAAAAAALSVRVYPAALAALFCLLLGAACTLPLRIPAPKAMAAGVAAAITLGLGRLVASGLALDPATGAGAGWTATAAGALLLLACSLVALWASRALARPLPSWAGRRAQNPTGGEPAILHREAGRERLEWELARAADYRRPLALCLLGLDRNPREEEPTAGPSDLEGRMGRIDQLLLHELGRFEVAAEHGTAERLLILPEVWADGYAETAGELCARAGGRVGRTVRAALVTFPFDGTGRDDLVADLELALEGCRAGDALVNVGPAGRLATGVADFAS
jgi:hypothetical protein